MPEHPRTVTPKSSVLVTRSGKQAAESGLENHEIQNAPVGSGDSDSAGQLATCPGRSGLVAVPDAVMGSPCRFYPGVAVAQSGRVGSGTRGIAAVAA
jgi:hypothetical protein